MNVLISTRNFYPYNNIGSFRINSFAKYFRKAGNSVTVVAEGERDEAITWNGCDIHYIKDPIMTPKYLHNLEQKNKKWTLRRVIRALESRIFLGGPCIWRAKTCKKVEELFQKNPQCKREWRER